jgi:hypothetical protein
VLLNSALFAFLSSAATVCSYFISNLYCMLSGIAYTMSKAGRKEKCFSDQNAADFGRPFGRPADRLLLLDKAKIPGPT